MDGMKNAWKNYLAACDALERLNHGGADVKSACKDLVGNAAAACATFCSTLHGYLNLDAAQEDHTHKKSAPLSPRKSDASRKKIKKKEARKDIPVAWKHAVQDCCIKAFPKWMGLTISAKLDTFAPGMVAMWLTSLKSLDSCAYLCNHNLAQTLDLMTKVKPSPLQITPSKDLSKKPSIIRVDDKGLQSDPAILQLLMHDVWPEVVKRGGFLASEWSSRVAAVELASMVASEECPRKMHVSVYQEMLEFLVFDMAIVDTQWQVKFDLIKLSSILQFLWAFTSPDILWNGLNLQTLLCFNFLCTEMKTSRPMPRKAPQNTNCT